MVLPFESILLLFDVTYATWYYVFREEETPSNVKNYFLITVDLPINANEYNINMNIFKYFC